MSDSPSFPHDALVLLVGAAGSGKSTWASAFDNGVVSTDGARALCGENQRDIRASDDAFTIVGEIVERRLARGLFTLVDSTGLEVVQRRRWVDSALRHGRPIHVVAFAVTAAECRRRNRARPDPVPQRVVDDQVRTIRELLRAPEELVPEADRVLVLDADPPRPAVGAGDVVAVTAPPAPSPPAPTAPADVAPVRVPGRPLFDSDRLGIGLHLSDVTMAADASGGFPAVVGWAREAEQAGVDSVWLMDHLVQIPQVGRRWDPILDPVTTLAAIASATERIHLGVLVSPVTFHHPALLAKRLATLDVLSGGRVVCGLGLGWFEAEHAAAGIEFPPVAERADRLVDTIGALRALWGPGAKPFGNESWRLDDTTAYPRPVRGEIPILVGGSGPRRTLAIAARQADACNVFGDPAAVAAHVGVYRDHLAEAGIDPATRRVTHLSTILTAPDTTRLDRALGAITPPRRSRATVAARVGAGTTDDHVERFRALRAAGVDHAMVSVADLGHPGALDRFGELVAAVRAAGI